MSGQAFPQKQVYLEVSMFLPKSLQIVGTLFTLKSFTKPFY
jgi:hypothetical protein